jgi:hypothetical protein
MAGTVVKIVLVVLGVIIILSLFGPKTAKLAEGIGKSLGLIQKCDLTGKVPDQYEADIQIALDNTDYPKALQLYEEFKRCFPTKKLDLDLEAVPEEKKYDLAANEFFAFCASSALTERHANPFALATGSSCASGSVTLAVLTAPGANQVYIPKQGAVAAGGAFSLCSAQSFAGEYKGRTLSPASGGPSFMPSIYAAAGTSCESGYKAAGTFKLAQSKVLFPQETFTDTVTLCVSDPLDRAITGKVPPVVLDKLVDGRFGDQCLHDGYTNVGHMKLGEKSVSLSFSTAEVTGLYITKLDRLAKALKAQEERQG